MKKLGKKNKLEKGTFMSYSCGCNCMCAACSCKNCNYSTPQAVGQVYLNQATNTTMHTKMYGGLVWFGN